MNAPMFPPLGVMADSYYEARAKRLALQKEVDEAKKLEDTAEAMLISALKAQGLEGAKGMVATAAIKRNDTVVLDKDEEGNIIGREAFENFILYTRDLGLLQFRPSLTRCKELWDAGHHIPGVSCVKVESISLTKVKK